jgi:hypothetical protein
MKNAFMECDSFVDPDRQTESLVLFDKRQLMGGTICWDQPCVVSSPSTADP